MYHYYRHNRPLGITLIIIGSIAIFVSIAPLIIPLLFVLGGLYLINRGLRFCGKPPINFFMIQEIWNHRYWR